MLCISLAVRVLSIHSISLNMILFNAVMSLLLLIIALRQSVRRLQELEVLANSLSEEVKEKSLALSHSRKTNRCIFLCMLYCLCFMVSILSGFLAPKVNYDYEGEGSIFGHFR